jgi:hypothetical protein
LLVVKLMRLLVLSHVLLKKPLRTDIGKKLLTCVNMISHMILIHSTFPNFWKLLFYSSRRTLRIFLINLLNKLVLRENSTN